MVDLLRTSYAASQGYVRARLSRLLDRAAWGRLLASRSGAELTASLQQTTLASAVARDDAVALQPLRGELASAAHAIARFLPNRPAQLVAWYNRRFEIDNLKAILRKIHYRLERPRVLPSLIPMPIVPWRWEAVLDAQSATELIDLLRESPYALPLEHAMERYRQEGRLFYLEVALDLFYFQKLVWLIERQTGSDAKDASQHLGRTIAIQNLLWAYRYRIYGRMTPEEIINYTLHRAFAAGLETVRRVALGSPLTVEAARLGFRLSRGRSETEALTEMEFLAEQERFRRATATILRPLFHLGGVLAYLCLAETEIRDLNVLAEGKTAGLSAEQIGPRLLRAA